jgi:two-component system NtrC family sensor kinase
MSSRSRSPALPERRPDRAAEPRAEAFARLFEAVHEGVYIGLASPGSTVTIAANPHLSLIFGFPADIPESGVKPFDDERFTDPRARALFLERLEADGAVTDYLLRLRRLDGTPIWVEVTARAHTDGTGGLRIDALVRDVSERKRLEAQKRDLYHQLLQAEKLAALGQTISGVAHELNNPLATILTWAERLAQRPSAESVRRGIDTILAESERAAKIVRNLLTFARKRQTTRALVDLNQVVRETMSLRAYEQRVSNISVSDALTTGLPQIFADPHQIQQVLLNLIMNAEQAMLAANGRGMLSLRSWYDGEHDLVILEIGDDGPGVPADLQPKIFDPFFTTKEVGKGTGLGLTVAYAIVEEHGGRLRMESRPTGGASFYVELPAGTSAAYPRKLTATDLALEELAGSTVLVVEDEPALALAVSEALADAGLVVDRASDGGEALAKVQAKSYDLVVCDLKMPRVGGMEFYRAIAAATPALARRVIFVTGDVAGTDAERFLAESGCRWLAKPFRLGDLLRTARDVLR